MSTSDALAHLPADLDFVALLIDGSQHLYHRLISDRTFVCHKLVHQDEGDRIVSGPDGRLYSAMFRLFIWKAPEKGRLVWFSLESQVPHMSSIVVCIASPKRTSQLPTIVVNLNMKRHLGSYGTVIGLRGGSACENLTDLLLKKSKTAPPYLLVKEWPAGFRGIRNIFTISSEAIEWSLSTAEDALTSWFRENDSSQGDYEGSRASLQASGDFLREMKEVHEGGGVFDAVFGEKWVSKIAHQLFLE